MIGSIIKAVFQDKLTTDDRVPFVTFDLGGKQWGFFLPQITIWIQVLVMILIQSTFSCIAAFVIYKVFIPHRESMFTRILGYCTIGFVCIRYPVYLIRYLDIHNRSLRFSICVLGPLGTFFRFIEAMNRFSPPAVESSLYNYMLYYASFLEVKFNPKTNMVVRATTSEAVSVTKEFLKSLFLTGAILSLFRQDNNPFYEPFPSSFDANTSNWKSLFTQIVNLHTFRNNVVAAIIFQFQLTAYTLSLGMMMISLCRVQVQGAFYNPLFEATSPSDFWGRRWNVMVHSYLKRGVFKPVLQFSSSKVLASISAFLASGLFHEWLLTNLFLDCSSFQPRLGLNTIFFMWNAGIIALEYLCGDSWIFTKIKTTLPRPMVTMLVICSAMPVAHWFNHPYTKSDFLTHGETVFPMIKRL